MTELVAALLSWAVLLTGDPEPAAPPSVEMVPHAFLEELACGAPCPIQGLYTYGAVVYLDDSLDPRSDLWARSVLLHELVHYVQETAGKYAGMDRCAAAVLRERQAYHVQNEYLARHGVVPRAGSSLHHIRCAVAAGG